MEKITTLTQCKTELERVQQEVTQLQKEKANLEILLQTIIEHADQLEVELRQKIQILLQEKQQLEQVLLATTSESVTLGETFLPPPISETTSENDKLDVFK